MSGMALVPSKEKQNTLRTMLEKAKPSLQAALPRHLDATKLIKVALAATARTPALLACTPQSVLQAVMQAAALGLEPGSVLGSAYLVPYGTECVLIPGYRGLIDLARRSGKITSIEAHVVNENDAFDIAFGLVPVLRHSPMVMGEPGSMVAVYAIATLHDGTKQVEFMTALQVDAIRQRSRAGNSGPWKTDYHEMARKTVVKRLCKYLPLSPELAAALEADNRAETGEVHGYSDILDITAAEPEEKDPVEAVRQKVADRAAAVREEGKDA